jgi:2-polyprenyl-3-methyl-5-hydroxy-6-metoxy-1,4-benzoquinol methylase
METAALKRIHEAERAFFDRRAAAAGDDLFVPVSQIHRYSRPGAKHAIDRMFRLAGPLAGLSVLDVGCGEGRNAVILAKMGARVTGIDISPESIEAARRRCAVNSAIAEFICTPFESATVPAEAFDIVWVDAFLHHMLHDLGGTLAAIRRTLKPGGRVLIKEPVNLFPPLRELRLKYGPPPDATPDERPLTREEVRLICDTFAPARVFHYHLFTRFSRKFARVDRALLMLPPLRPLAGLAVIEGRKS